MKIINRRLAELEARIVTGDLIPVMVVEEAEDGRYAYGNKIFTAAELDEHAEKHHTERIIIDDMGLSGDDGLDSKLHGYYETHNLDGTLREGAENAETTIESIDQ